MIDRLRTQMELFQKCIEERDRAAAERILDDDYALVLVQPARAQMPRDRWLDVLADYDVRSYELQESVVDVDGDVASVLQRAHMNAVVQGQDRSGVFIISDVWRLRGDEWRLWRRHSTPLSAGTLPASKP